MDEVLECQAYILFYVREGGRSWDGTREGEGQEEDHELAAKRSKVDPT